jgi:hypothetical protein
MWTVHQAEASFRLLQQGVGLLLIVVGVAAWPVSAFAYRPFDGTDAAVAEPGESRSSSSLLESCADRRKQP